MFITNVEAKNFRNYNSFNLDFSSSINLFLGDNGQGKTSVLEALHYALRGKSFKPYIQHQFIKEGSLKASVDLKIKEEEGLSSIESEFIKRDKTIQKKIQYCGKKAGPTFLHQKFPLFVFTEEKMKSIRGSSDQRRLLIDDILIFEGFRNEVHRFQKTLKEKNSLLRQYKKEQISYKDMLSILEALNPLFLKASVDLTKARLNQLDKIFKLLQEETSFYFFNQDNKPDLDYSYLISQKSYQFKDQDQIEEILAQRLEARKEQEIQLGYSLSGPHKHDLCFLYDGLDSRVYCSQGQQRIYMLSLMASQMKSQPTSLLFLDDVLMELDEKKEEQFLNFLNERPSQSFITNCKKMNIKLKKMSSFLIKNATIRAYD